MPTPIRSICVFCGAAPGSKDSYVRHAHELGQLLADRGITLVYGGGGIGMMGAVADGALSRGGRITGVITRQLVDRELAHPAVGDMRVVETMHERKMLMVGLADAFIALPGGYGTFDEFFEAVCWAQLEIHRKPIGLLNTMGFYNGLFSFLEHAEGEGFLRLPLQKAVTLAETPSRLLDALDPPR